jgi:hypothetical protein
MHHTCRISLRLLNPKADIANKMEALLNGSSLCTFTTRRLGWKTFAVINFGTKPLRGKILCNSTISFLYGRRFLHGRLSIDWDQSQGNAHFGATDRQIYPQHSIIWHRNLLWIEKMTTQNGTDLGVKNSCQERSSHFFWQIPYAKVMKSKG